MTSSTSALVPSSLIKPTSTIDSAIQTLPSFNQQALNRLLGKRMRKHLCVKVSEENKRCYKAKVLSQCLSYVMNDACNYGGCPQEHVPMRLLNQTQYNARPHLRRYPSVKSNIAGWLNHLYEAVFPPVCYQGSVADIDWSTIQNASDGIRIVREWVRDSIYSLDPINDPETFSYIDPSLTKLSFAFDELDSIQYITQARSVRFFRHPELLRGPEEA
ncbi:hypothetical protein BU15DRAFT_82916 [Melanogaster broomeanus]|nr:hypothetical protein BU15DRAFT_82916 [Melanogaster broomeanus]